MNFDIAIVGNGSTGLTLAVEILKTSSKIKLLVIGDNKYQGSASRTAGAMLNCWGEISHGTFEDFYQKKRFELPTHAIELWDNHSKFLKEKTGHDLNIKWGTVVFTSPRGPKIEEVSFNYLEKQLDVQTINSRKLSPEDFDFLSPDQDKRPIRGLTIPDGMIDSKKLLDALESFILQSSTEYILSKCISLMQTQNKQIQLKLENGSEIIAEKVILANGAYSRDLIENSFLRNYSILPLFFGGGSALEVNLPSWTSHPKKLQDLNLVVRTLDRGGACGLHLIPLGNDTFYFGASSGVWENPESGHRNHAIAWLTNSLEHDFHHNFFSASINLRGPGYRPVSLDTFPLLGPVEDTNVLLLNGTKRDGLTCSPYYAKIFTEYLLEGKNNNYFNIFNPVRKAISFFDKEIAIQKAVDSEIGGEIMHGIQVPPYKTEEWQEQKRLKIENIYSNRNFSNYGIHPELIHFYQYDSYFEKYVKNFV